MIWPVWSTLLLSALAPLAVALVNLLVAGHVVSSRSDRQQLVFAAGPAGVGIWALCWFMSFFSPESEWLARSIGAAGAVVAIGAFAWDAWRISDAKARRASGRAAAAVVALGLIAIGALAVRLGTRPTVLFNHALRLIGAALVSHVFLAWRSQALSDEVMRARTGQSMMRATVAVAGAAAVATAYAIFVHNALVDPILFLVLLVELYALIYISKQRISAELIFSRAIVYLLFSLLITGLAALLFRQLGYETDLVAIAVTVSLSLLATALFMGLSERMTSRLQRVLFPQHAEVKKALEASRGELESLKKRLEHAERLAIAGELAASVAHEIKNPLAPIRGYAQLLERRLEGLDAPTKAFFQKGLGIIRDETDRIDRRVADLLDLSRSDSSQAGATSVFEFQAVILEAIAVAEGYGRSELLRPELAPDLGEVEGDPDRIRSALVNLIKNAFEAIESQGRGTRIDVRAYRAQKSVVVEVEDDGPGLGSEAPERVFEPFHTTKKGGTGLGLSIARSAIEAAGGTLTVDNRSGGTGTAARIELRSFAAADDEATSGSAPMIGEGVTDNG